MNVENSESTDSRRSTWIPLALGLLAAAAVTALLLAQRSGNQELTREALEQARSRWREQGPKNYSLGVRVSGIQQGDHRIVVVGREVTEMTTGGAPVRESARHFWSVDGMFEFLDEELRQAERATGSDIILQAAFDEDLGYPRRFLRHVVGQTRDIEWGVYSFEPSR